MHIRDKVASEYPRCHNPRAHHPSAFLKDGSYQTHHHTHGVVDGNKQHRQSHRHHHHHHHGNRDEQQMVQREKQVGQVPSPLISSTGSRPGSPRGDRSGDLHRHNSHRRHHHHHHKHHLHHQNQSPDFCEGRRSPIPEQVYYPVVASPNQPAQPQYFYETVPVAYNNGNGVTQIVENRTCITSPPMAPIARLDESFLSSDGGTGAIGNESIRAIPIGIQQQQQQPQLQTYTVVRDPSKTPSITHIRDKTVYDTNQQRYYYQSQRSPQIMNQFVGPPPSPAHTIETIYVNGDGDRNQDFDNRRVMATPEAGNVKELIPDSKTTDTYIYRTYSPAGSTIVTVTDSERTYIVPGREVVQPQQPLVQSMSTVPITYNTSMSGSGIRNMGGRTPPPISECHYAKSSRPTVIEQYEVSPYRSTQQHIRRGMQNMNDGFTTTNQQQRVQTIPLRTQKSLDNLSQSDTKQDDYFFRNGEQKEIVRQHFQEHEEYSRWRDNRQHYDDFQKMETIYKKPPRPNSSSRAIYSQIRSQQPSADTRSRSQQRYYGNVQQPFRISPRRLDDSGFVDRTLDSTETNVTETRQINNNISIANNIDNNDLKQQQQVTEIHFHRPTPIPRTEDLGLPGSPDTFTPEEQEAIVHSFQDISEVNPTTLNELGEGLFKARLDLTHFRRHEIEAKLIDGVRVVVKASHDERFDNSAADGRKSPCARKRDESGKHFMTKRDFFTSYTLPTDCDTQRLRAYITRKGFLIIECPRIPSILSPASATMYNDGNIAAQKNERYVNELTKFFDDYQRSSMDDLSHQGTDDRAGSLQIYLD